MSFSGQLSLNEYMSRSIGASKPNSYNSDFEDLNDVKSTVILLSYLGVKYNEERCFSTVFTEKAYALNV